MTQQVASPAFRLALSFFDSLPPIDSFYCWNCYDRTRAHIARSRDRRASLEAWWNWYEHTRAHLARGVPIVDRVKKPVTSWKPCFMISTLSLSGVWSTDVTTVSHSLFLWLSSSDWLFFLMELVQSHSGTPHAIPRSSSEFKSMLKLVWSHSGTSCERGTDCRSS